MMRIIYWLGIILVIGLLGGGYGALFGLKYIPVGLIIAWGFTGAVGALVFFTEKLEQLSKRRD